MIVNLSGHCQPSKLMQKMTKHRGDLSIGDKATLIAKRIILGQQVSFYSNGEHVIEGSEIPLEQQYESEILRFAHASLLINEGVGDKRKLYVDASVNPVKVWLHGSTVGDFLRKAKHGISTGLIDTDEVVYGDPVPKIRSI